MTHRIEIGQEYAICAAWPDDFRIRILGVPVRGAYGGDKARIATITEDGRLIRERRVSVRQLHVEAATGRGQRRRTGYVLVQHADGTKAEGSSER